MEPRTFLSSRFRILPCIGSGSTGDVYEAIDREHGARVALKALRHLLPHAITRFEHVDQRGVHDHTARRRASRSRNGAPGTSKQVRKRDEMPP